MLVLARWSARQGKALRAEALASMDWPAADGTVAASYIGKIVIDDEDIPVACVRYVYRVAGQEFQSDRIGSGGYLKGKRKQLDDFVASHPAGKTLPVYYNPQDPAKAVLIRGEAGGSAGQWMFAAVMFAVIGVLSICAIVYLAFKS
jgi:hypothetical protein